MRAGIRRLLPGSMLLALFVGLWIGWNLLRSAVEDWVLVEHRVGAWSVRVFGGSLETWRFARADSVRVVGPGTQLVIADPRLRWETRDGVALHRFPFHLAISIDKVTARLGRSESTRPSSAPAFPSSLRLPVSFEAIVDTIRVEMPDGRVAMVDRIRLASRGATGVSARLGDLRVSGVPAWVSGNAGIDWSGDSLRGDARLALSSGCCARDSASLEFVLDHGDLTAGRAKLRADIGSLAGWNEVLPGIVRAPLVEDISLELEARRARAAHPSVVARLAFGSGNYLFLPGLGWTLRLSLDSSRTAVSVDASGKAGESLKAQLAAEGDPWAALRNDRFSGRVEIGGLGYILLQQKHPFDGVVEVEKIGLGGGAGVVRLASGSVVTGGAVWKGLHWHCQGVIAPGEPWAVRWVPGLSLERESFVSGRDTAGAALFHAFAMGPRYRWISADSLSVSAHLNTKRIVFPSIRLVRGDRIWSGSGGVDWTARGYGFVLGADSGSGSTRVEGDFLGGVRATLDDMPIQGLPIDHERARLPYPVVATAQFERKAPIGSDPGGLDLSASLRAMPGADSLRVDFEAWQRGATAEIPSLRIALGEGRVEASAGARLDSIGWSPTHLKAAFDGVDLGRFASVWPGLPVLGGRVEGTLAAARDEGVSARAKIAGLSMQGEKGWTTLPDLVVWGARDTLRVGGRWPLGGELDPFRLTLTGLFDRKLAFEFLAFHGDIVRLRGSGVLEDRSKLHATLTADGGIAIPGTEARLEGLLVEGELRGQRNPDGFAWSASLEGRDGVLRAIKGLPLRSRFLVRAEPGLVLLDSLSLRGERAGDLTFTGRYDLSNGSYTGSGRARDFRLELGEGKRFRLGSMDLVAGADQRLRASLSKLSLEQTWGRGEGLWVDVDKADLVLVQAKDWRKLQGTAQVGKLLYTRPIADFGSVAKGALGRFTGRTENRREVKTESVPLLLDIRAWGGGDSIRIDNNLARASMTFDLQATGPVDALLLNGTLDADPDGSTFGYAGKTFELDELHVEWNVAPPLGGKYSMAGSRSILQACPDANATSGASDFSSTDSCSLKLSSEGTLSDPRMYPLSTDCGAGGADEGAVQAALALARNCYPSDDGQGTNSIGGNARSAAIDLGVQQGMGYVNDAIGRQLERQRREGRIFLPDSLALTDVPIGGVRDQLGLLAFYRLSDDMDAEGEYRHTFVRAATATSGATVLADDYSLRLRWRPPLEWIQERRIQQRLRNHLVFQVEVGQSLDSRSQRETVLSPSIRYRWEFW